MSLEASASLDDVVTLAEGADAHETLASRTEAHARGCDDLALGQNLVEDVPRVTAREVYEGVGRVNATVVLDVALLQSLTHQPCVLEVVLDDLLYGRHVVEHGNAAGLRHGRGAIEDGAHDAAKILLDRGAVGPLALGRAGHPAQADARETGQLREGSRLDGALFGTWDFVDGLGAVGVSDEGRVGRVEDKDLSVGLAEGHQFCELSLGGAGTGGVVGVAEHDDISVLGNREVREEAIVGRAGHVRDAIVLLGIRIAHARATGNDGGVDIHGVRRVLRRDLGRGAEEELEAAKVALRSVRYEHFVGLDHVVVDRFGDLGLELSLRLGVIPLIALKGAEALGVGSHGIGDGAGKGVRGITDAEGNELRIRVGVEELLLLLVDHREKIAS
mmetsp:Transcript_9636/g.15255  ORF Transcript_9636/g.15255 Transcript_9636/m.15255 type:complete len:388 (-) Transcript_9636:77-1240(-)